MIFLLKIIKWLRKNPFILALTFQYSPLSLHTELSSRGYQHQVLNMSVRIGKKNEKVNDHYSEMAKQHCVQYQFE